MRAVRSAPGDEGRLGRLGVEQLGDRPQLGQHGAAGRLGGVGGEHGAHLEPVGDGRPARRRTRAPSAISRGRAVEPAAVDGPAPAQLAAPVDLLDDVGQVEVGVEGAHERTASRSSTPRSSSAAAGGIAARRASAPARRGRAAAGPPGGRATAPSSVVTRRTSARRAPSASTCGRLTASRMACRGQCPLRLAVPSPRVTEVRRHRRRRPHRPDQRAGVARARRFRDARRPGRARVGGGAGQRRVPLRRRCCHRSPGRGCCARPRRRSSTRDGPLRIRPHAVPSMLRWSIGFFRAANRRALRRRSARAGRVRPGCRRSR